MRHWMSILASTSMGKKQKQIEKSTQNKHEMNIQYLLGTQKGLEAHNARNKFSISKNKC